MPFSHPSADVLSASTESSFVFMMGTPSEVSDPFNHISPSLTSMTDSPPSTPLLSKMSANEFMHHSEFYMPEGIVVFQVGKGRLLS